jgi:DNA-binding GntR family transcriptional regulator
MSHKKITASQRLQRKFEESILGRQYLPGDRLPSERDIMKGQKSAAARSEKPIDHLRKGA